MPHTDPHRLTGDDAAPDASAPPEGNRRDLGRGLLWTVVVISAVVNLAASFDDAGTSVNLACGAVTLVFGGILAARYLRGRR